MVMEQFSYVKRGYSPEEVNKYIATLEQVIKSYKEKDNAIKNAIISAQVAADSVVRNAQMQAKDYKKRISQQLLQISAAIDTERMRVQAFYDIYMSMVRKHLYDIKSTDMLEVSQRLNDMDELVSELLEMDMPFLNEGTPLLPDNVTPPTQTYTTPPVMPESMPEALPEDVHYNAPQEQPPLVAPQPKPKARAVPAPPPPMAEAEDIIEEPPVAPPPRYV